MAAMVMTQANNMYSEKIMALFKREDMAVELATIKVQLEYAKKEIDNLKEELEHSRGQIDKLQMALFSKEAPLAFHEMRMDKNAAPESADDKEKRRLEKLV